ncbi:hypothetical protein ABVT39_005742 [Epinephelus coioides]
MSKALLAGEVPPVFRLKRKLDDMTEAEERKKRCHQTAAPDVQEVETTEEEPGWRHSDILSMDGTCTEEALQQLANLFDATLDVNDDDKELILEPFKFLFYNIEDMWLFCEEIMDKRGYMAYCEFKE